jgi:polyvinyl alcohol dehydrogenase (cytochrome)
LGQQFSHAPRFKSWLVRGGLSAVFALGFGAFSFAQQGPGPVANPGETVFKRNCDVCHKPEGAPGGNERAPRLETLKAYPAERILDALVTGKMQTEGARLSTTQQQDVSEWLSGAKLGNSGADIASMKNRCSGPATLNGLTGWNGWSPDIANSRFQTSAALSAADVPKLKLKWAFGVPGAAQLQSQPTVAGGMLFVGSDSGNIFALDANTGCLHWTAKADAGVRTAPVVAPLDGGNGPATVFVGDRRGTLFAFDALTGKAVWTSKIDPDPVNGAGMTDAPVYYRGRLYVGLTGSGEAGPPDRGGVECCHGRGQIAAVDTKTGKVIWKTYTLPEATATVDSNGRRRWGPSGVGVWATPTVDAKRGRLYVTTANAYSGPSPPLENSVMALDLKTGKILWSHQEVPDDIWRSGCVGKDGSVGCPDKVGPDYDFSSSAMLQKLPNGREILVAANKGGVAIGLNPENGKLIWHTNLWEGKEPSFYGDVLFGGASDGAKAYFALQETSAVTALDLRDGKKVWSQPFKPLVVPDPIGGHTQRKGFGAAVSGMPGVVFVAGWDGVLHALSTVDGKEVWTYATLKPFDTINGVRAKGGSLGGPGVTIVNGVVYAVSGYVGVSNGVPGNVVLAFAP